MAKTKAPNSSSSSADKKAKRSYPPADQLVAAIKTELARNINQKQTSAAALFKALKIKSPLIIVGSEHLRLKRLLAWIRENVFPVNQAVGVYFGSELGTESAVRPILTALQSQSLFAEEELIVIHDLDQLKANPARLLAAALKASANSSTFIIGTATAINTKTILVNELQNNCSIAEIKPLQGEELKHWIVAEVKRCGIGGGISADAISMLAEIYQEDIDSLAQEIAKMALLLDEHTAISKPLVQKLIAKTPLRQSFDLLRFIANKNAVNAALLAHELAQQGMHPLQLVAFLSRCFRVLLALKTNENRATLGPELGNPWFIKNLQSSLNQYSAEELLFCLNKLKILDLALKSSKLSETVNLLTCIHQITART